MQNITKYVADKMKFYRKKKNITQQELAEYLGTTQQSIARYESGERKANQDTLFALAEYYNISINDFFPSIDSNESKTEDDLRELLKAKGIMDNNDYINKKDADKLMKIIDLIKEDEK